MRGGCYNRCRSKEGLLYLEEFWFAEISLPLLGGGHIVRAEPQQNATEMIWKNCWIEQVERNLSWWQNLHSIAGTISRGPLPCDIYGSNKLSFRKKVLTESCNSSWHLCPDKYIQVSYSAGTRHHFISSEWWDNNLSNEYTQLQIFSPETNLEVLKSK